MKAFFDTSVLVPAMVDQLSNHPACFNTFHTYTSHNNQGFCSTHCLAEFYSVLTALPLPKRISTVEARILIEENILGRLNIISLDQSDYLEAITTVSINGLTSGIVYDALHIAAAKKAGCSRIYTYNIDHFRSICPEEILLTSP